MCVGCIIIRILVDNIIKKLVNVQSEMPLGCLFDVLVTLKLQTVGLLSDLSLIQVVGTQNFVSFCCGNSHCLNSNV
jgi:hypothetical protein